MPSLFVPFQSRAGAYVVALFRDWRLRFSLRRSLHALGSDERNRILRESGLDAADLEVCLSTVFGSENLISRLIQEIGLDQEYIRRSSPEVMRDLERTCMTCRSRRYCRSMLTRGEAARFTSFCPNAATLTYLIEELPVARNGRVT